MKKIKNAAVVAAGILASANPALAEEATQAASGNYNGIAAGLTIAIAAVGGAIAQAKVASTALESIGRNPGAAGQMGTPTILGLVLIESLVLYALVIAFMLL